MTLASNLQSQNYEFQLDTSTGRWKWTTQYDISGAVAVFRVLNIVSPYGILRDSVPIPGDVISAMAESITEIKANFPPSILVGPPTLLTFEVDEGRGFSDPQAVSVTNGGIYGSLLSASLATSAEYVVTDPVQMTGLAFNQAGAFEVSVDSTNLLATESPYAEVVTISDPNADNSPQTLAVTIVVRPKAAITLSPTVLNFTVAKPLTGDFPLIPTQTFTVENTGPAGSVLDFQIQRVGCSGTWLKSFGPVSGSLLSGETEAITVNVIPDANLAVGTYEETLRVSGYSETAYEEVTIRLTITQ
jgi:hypothetical protein